MCEWGRAAPTGPLPKVMTRTPGGDGQRPSEDTTGLAAAHAAARWGRPVVGSKETGVGLTGGPGSVF